jgi:hypothetical protein
MSRTILVCFLLLLTAGRATAAPMNYDFSYQFPVIGNEYFDWLTLQTVTTYSQMLVYGSLVGELQSDGDTILVSSVLSATYHSAFLGFSPTNPPEPVIYDISPTALPTSPGVFAEQIVTFSGNFVQLGYGDGPTFPAGGPDIKLWSLDTEVGSSGLVGIRDGSGLYVDGLNPSRWQIVAEVPAPASAWLLTFGLMLLRRRRERVVS